ncbi:AsmA family protein [Herbaspirillum sp. WKF16]|uniref:AsmA family protein n=1 Tax=Herbaspirillum sp. WKF16 TaxID=3028312 RepID=UPI0023A97929|nr:AsmA family protein [Herbaspirillum sp. WKF16]WDZ94156.1 AsmA family protein [Herbaspirillum sp. WKF16]
MHHRLRWLRWPLLVAGGLLAALAALALAVQLLDWNLAKPWVLARLSAVLERRVSVDGELRLGWSRGPDSESGDTRWLPRLALSARQVAIANTDWSTSGPLLARADSVALTFSPLQLLRKHWLITDLRLQGVELVMERASDRRKNWRFSQAEEPAWSYDIRRLEFERAKVRYVDLPLKMDLAFDISPLPGKPQGALKDGTPDFAIAGAISGRYNQAQLSARAQGGPLLDLLNDGALYPLRAEGEIGRVRAAIDGTLTNPHRLARADLNLKLSGATLADLYPATGVLLPPSRAFRTQGQLAIIRAGGKPPTWDWRYERFTGTVGESDFAGDARYLRGQGKPQLRTTVHSRLLRLADLVPPNQEGGKGSRGGKLLPAHPFEPQRWDALDAEISFSGDRFALLPKAIWQDARAEIRLKDRVLSFDPLRFSMAGGRAEGALLLDGRQDLIGARLRLAAHGLQVKQLFPGLGALQASFGQLDGSVELAGAGNSIGAMLGTADGKLDARISEGSISKFILEAAGLNLADAVFAKFYRDKQVRLHCAVADVRVAKGQAELRRFELNTEDALIEVGGRIDLAREALDLSIHPHTKRLRVLSLRTPLSVTGSFSHPVVGAEGGSLAARAGAAAALALVAPLAALAPLITPGEDIPDDCRAPLTHKR